MFPVTVEMFLKSHLCFFIVSLPQKCFNPGLNGRLYRPTLVFLTINVISSSFFMDSIQCRSESKARIVSNAVLQILNVQKITKCVQEFKGTQ